MVTERHLFSWIHVSDTHFGFGDVPQRLDRELVLTELRRDAEHFKKHKIPRPQALFITGDVAFSGSVLTENEYESAYKWISDLAAATKIESNRIFVVPGNHDVQRNIERHHEITAQLLRDIRSGDVKIDNTLSDPEKRLVLMKRLKNFANFSKKFPACATDQPYWLSRFPVGPKVLVRVVGLNTAMICADNNDRGKIELGKTQLSHAFLSEDIKDNEVIIVLTHHPLDWLKDYELARDLIAKHAHIHLCGHIHEAHNAHHRSGGGNDFVRIVAGAAHDGLATEAARFGYSFGALIKSGKQGLAVRVWPRVWSRKNCDFRRDEDNIPESSEFAQHPLRIKLRPQRTQNEGYYNTPPYRVEDFAYRLPARPSLPADLAPIPCVIEKTQCGDAFTALANQIFDYYEARHQETLRIHQTAWREADEELQKSRDTAEADEEFQESKDRAEADDQVKSSRKATGPSVTVLRKRRLDIYYRLVNLALPSVPSSIWLLVTGDTGTGKTTLVKQLAHCFPSDFADLRDYSTSKSFTDIIQDFRPNQAGGKQSKASRLPRILIVDAWDKMVPGATYQVMVNNLRAIRSLANRYDIVIITARSAFFRTQREEQLPDSKHIKLLPLENDQVLRLARNAGVDSQLVDALKQSSSVRDLSSKPLLLQLIIGMLRDGRDITGLEDDEDLFAYVVDSWLTRDIADSVLPSDIRLKCMQCLALYSLSTGGGPFSYSSIDALIKRVLQPQSELQVESFNTDLRVCGFLKRQDPDVFEFQHATFYEYCVARSVFEDLARNDVFVLDSHSFTQEIIQLITLRAQKKARTQGLVESIENAWKSNLGSTGRINLLRLYNALEGNCSKLPLDNLVIEKQNIEGINYKSLRNVVVRNVTFRECSFAGVDFGRVTGENWSFDRCLISDCKFGYARFHSGEFINTHLRICSNDTAHFSVCNWMGGIIEAFQLASVTIEGGRLQKVILGSLMEDSLVDRSQWIPSIIRLATLENIIFRETALTWRIEMCSVDQLTLYELSTLKRHSRPGLSVEIHRQVTAWKNNPAAVRAVTNPYVRSKPEADKSLDQTLTKSQRRKIRRKIKDALGRSGES